MRALAKLLLILGLAVTLSTSAGAVSIGLLQVGETFIGPPKSGDTLVLNITYSLDPGDSISLIQVGLRFPRSILTFDPADLGAPRRDGRRLPPMEGGCRAAVDANYPCSHPSRHI